MNWSTFPMRKTLVLIGTLIVSASVYAQNTMPTESMTGMTMSDSMVGPSMAPAADVFSTFVQEWKSAEEAMMFSAEQREKLAMTLKAASMRLSENWGAIENYRKLAATSSGDTQMRYKKRIDLEFSERELIVTETESELLSFLNEDQTNLVLTAAFHGVSPSHSGSIASMSMGGMGGMGGMETMDDVETRISEFAETLNADFRAVSIDRIIDDLLSH